MYFLNYGDFDGELFGATYVKLGDKQKNGTLDWSTDIKDYLETLDDEKVIFALDDYFLEKDIDMETFNGIDKDLKVVNLCEASKDNDKKFSITTQYTLWDRLTLIDILKQVKTPWDFECEGSQYFNKKGGVSVCIPCLKYPEWSALSSRWKGVRTYGRDIQYL